MRGRFGEKLTEGECEKKRCFPLCVSWEDTYILRFESEAERVRERLEEREKRAGTWEKHAVCHFCTQHVSSLRFSRALRWISLEPDSSILAEFYLSTVWELSLWAWTCCCCQQTRDIHRTVSPGFFFCCSAINSMSLSQWCLVLLWTRRELRPFHCSLRKCLITSSPWDYLSVQTGQLKQQHTSKFQLKLIKLLNT